jgi:hypothetical protein
MIAKSIKGSSTEEIQNALNISLKDGYSPTLAIVFISIKNDRNAVCKILSDLDIDVIGATSSGEFIDGHQSLGETVIMLLDIPKDEYTILLEDIGERDLGRAATQLAKEALNKFEKPAFILLSTGLSTKGVFLKGETLIRSIEATIGSHVNMFGGMAGDDITFTGTYVFTNNKSTDYGMATLVLDENKIDLYGMAISGWKPLGVHRTVTKSSGNEIYTIDDQPAIDLYLRFLGKESSSKSDQIAFFENVGVHYPLQIEREGREPLMCAPIGYDKEKDALLCESEVQQGSKFRFSTPPDFDICETIKENALALKNEKKAEADALLIFSCAGRLNALGPLAQEENEGLVDVWKVPMAGFYTYGEYGRDLHGKHEFHSTTCSWVAIKEKA